MKNFLLKDIPESAYFSKPTYLDAQFIITAPEMPITVNLLRMISQWGFSEIHSDGEPCEHYASETTHDTKEHASFDRSSMVDLDKVQRAEDFCLTFQKYVKNLIAFLPIKNELDFNNIAEHLKGTCDFVRENRRFLLRTHWFTNKVQEENQLVSHTARSTIIALIIGMNLKLQNYRLIELGVAALLHEIGMIKLPQEVFLKKGILTEQERKLMSAHPILGYNMLKAFDFPLVICLAALEHHERENGSGYPQRKTSDKISQYSKIIAVACSYEAILSSRPHKGGKDGHSGIMELLKNEGKGYDDSVIRALVYSVSLYPIGTYVLLSNNKKGQVVDANPENPRYPIVEVFGELLPNGKNKIAQTSANGFSIVRALSADEAEG
ncbi:MAG: HD-GYP domain-containing protein [Treponema sp.]|jgi:HD-GYP domain-containing protein (c-di-GMP phosphodiesterase class II)|nr:HD-GYP domain-containing protein [Treponema sp.]